jgi:hypothetical protein
MKKTFKELNEIDQVVGVLYQQNPSIERTKFGYAFKRFSEKSFMPTLNKYNEELAYLRIDNAMEDEKTKELIVDRGNPRGFKFTKDGLKAVLKGESDLKNKYDKVEIEVEPYISSYVPEELNDIETEILKGLLI